MKQNPCSQESTGKIMLLLALAAMLFIGSIIMVGISLGIALPNFLGGAHAQQAGQQSGTHAPTIGLENNSAIDSGAHNAINASSQASGRNSPGSSNASGTGNTGNTGNAGNTGNGTSLNGTGSKLPDNCAFLEKDSIDFLSAVGSNGFAYNQTEWSNNGTYYSIFRKGILSDARNSRILFLGANYTLLDAQPPICTPDYRVIMGVGNSFDYNGYKIEMADMRMPVCNGCPSIADIKVTSGNESFEKELIPYTGARVAQGSLPRLGLQVTDTRYDLGLVEMQVCADTSGQIDLKANYNDYSPLAASEKAIAGYTLSMANIRDNGSAADLEIRNPIGLEGRIFGVKPGDRMLFITANRTTLFIQASPFLVSTDGFLNDGHIALQEGAAFCGMSVHLNWTTLQGGDEPDALAGISLARKP